VLLSRELQKQIVKRKAEYLLDPSTGKLIVPPFEEAKFIFYRAYYEEK
jgi:hypothetical protein